MILFKKTDMQLIKLLSCGQHMDYQHILIYLLVLDHTILNIHQKQLVIFWNIRCFKKLNLDEHWHVRNIYISSLISKHQICRIS